MPVTRDRRIDLIGTVFGKFAQMPPSDKYNVMLTISQVCRRGVGHREAWQVRVPWQKI